MLFCLELRWLVLSFPLSESEVRRIKCYWATEQCPPSCNAWVWNSSAKFFTVRRGCRVRSSTWEKLWNSTKLAYPEVTSFICLSAIPTRGLRKFSLDHSSIQKSPLYVYATTECVPCKWHLFLVRYVTDWQVMLLIRECGELCAVRLCYIFPDVFFLSVSSHLYSPTSCTHIFQQCPKLISIMCGTLKVESMHTLNRWILRLVCIEAVKTWCVNGIQSSDPHSRYFLRHTVHIYNMCCLQALYYLAVTFSFVLSFL